jgi:hypothetical protein
MHVTWTITGDGLLAFAGGALALFGVWWSNRQSARNLQDQFDADKRSRREDLERQKKAIATGLLYEIDNFFRLELEGIEKMISQWNEATDLPPTGMPFRRTTFDVFRGSCPVLGLLGPKSVSAITKFYLMAEAYQSLASDYQRLMDLASTDIRANPYATGRAAIKLKELRKIIPATKELATRVTVAVANDCGLEELVAKGDAQAH